MIAPRLRVLSLGAGVQSTTMALMAAHGEIGPMPDCAIFADTQGEPAAVYDHLNWLTDNGRLPFPVHIVSKGNLWDAATRVRTRRDGGASYIATGLPVYLKNGHKNGMGRRQCTRDYKIDPIIRKVRKLLGRKSIRRKDGVLVEMWMGISTDEAQRMKPARQPWIEARWPLIENGLSRQDCLAWMERHGFPQPPKSACTFCPYHSDAAWQQLTPDEFFDATQKEKELQAAYAETTAMRGTPYLHSSRVPLGAVVLKDDDQFDLFGDECEGMCGV